MNERQNLVAVSTGMIGSGKSRLLHDRYVSRHPRVLHIDDNDEVRERIPGAVRVVGAGAMFDALSAAARRGARRFNIAAVGLESDELGNLLGVLAPRAGGAGSLARAFGTLALEWGEAGAACLSDARVGLALNVALMRSRHHGLSLFLATQYPYALPPSTRTNCHEVAFLQQDEQQALVWARQVVGDEGARCVQQLRNHSFLLYQRLTGLLYLCDRHRAVIRRFRKDGAAA